jgi:hypothetical protein
MLTISLHETDRKGYLGPGKHLVGKLRGKVAKLFNDDIFLT